MDVRMPDGTIITNVPEGVTRTQLMEKLNKAQEPDIDTTPTAFDPGQESARAQKLEGQSAGVNIQAAREVSGIERNPQFQHAVKQAVGEFDRRKATAESGVVQDEELPISSVAAGFSNNPVETIKTELTRNFRENGSLGPNDTVTMRIGPKSGEIEYLDPSGDKPKWKEMNMDFASKAGFLLPAAGDVIGTIAGGVAGAGAGPAGALAGETVGSGVGSGVGEILRLTIGRMMGFNNLSTEQILTSALGEAALAAGVTLTVGGAVVGVKSMRNFIKGNSFNKQAALDAGMNSEQADAVLDSVNKMLNQSGSDNQVLTTTAKRTKNVRTGALESEIKSHKDFAERFAARESADQAAITEATDIAGRPFTTGPAAPIQTVSDVVGEQVAKSTGKARRIVSQNKAELKSSLDSLDSITPASAGADIRPVLMAKRDAAKEAIDNANDSWRALTDFDEKTGLTGIRIPLTKGVKELKGKLSRESREAITNLTKQSKSRIFGASDDAALAQKEEDFLSQWLGESPKQLDVNKAFDLQDYNIALGDLKRAQRTASKNGTLTDPAIRDMGLAIGELEKARNVGLIKAGKRDVLDALLDAEKKRKEFGDVYERSIVGNLLEPKGAGFTIKDPDIMRQIINSNKDEIDVLLRVVGDNPHAMNQVRKAVLGEYKKRVVRNGIPKEDLHKEWIASHIELLKKLFTKQELREVVKLGKLGTVVFKQDKQIKRILKNAEKDWGRGKLSSLDPEKMVDFVTNNSSVVAKPTKSGAIQVAEKKVKWLKNSLREHPAAWRGVQKEYAQRIQENLIKDGLLQPKQMDKLLENKAVLNEMFGPSYVKSLETIREAGKLVNQNFSRLGGNELLDAAVQFIRGTSFAPPLSQRGRRFTAGLLLYRKVNHEKIAEALLNPKEIEKIAELATHSTITRETLELAASLGMQFTLEQ